MKLGSCIHFEELRSTLHSILSVDLFYGSLTFVEFFAFRSEHEKGHAYILKSKGKTL